MGFDQAIELLQNAETATEWVAAFTALVRVEPNFADFELTLIDNTELSDEEIAEAFVLGGGIPE